MIKHNSSSEVFLACRDPAEAENDLALTSSTVSELAEARRITYSSGRWIWDDQNGETSISITGPHVTLPSNGDCSAYYSWVVEKSGNQGPGTELMGNYCTAHIKSISSYKLKQTLKALYGFKKIYIFICITFIVFQLVTHLENSQGNWNCVKTTNQPIVISQCSDG